MAETKTAAEMPKLDDDVQSELIKQHNLNHVEVVEKIKLPTKEDVENERQHVKLVQGIENFKPNTLRQVSTEEKNVLPSPTDIALEKTPQLVANFDKKELHPVETVVKTGMPTADEYVREKVKVQACNFDHSELHHVEPEVKTNVAVIDE
uniref:Uncharacterized protein n=1 Tax=Panagrolaimus sp. JU765 TaxID=591449 RepID=A0AC34QTA2_9BILA